MTKEQNITKTSAKIKMRTENRINANIKLYYTSMGKIGC